MPFPKISLSRADAWGVDTHMLVDTHPDFLVASNSAELVAAVGASLSDNNMQLRTADSAEILLEAIRTAPVPCLVLLDIELPGMPIEQLLARLRPGADDRRFPLVLISDDGIPDWRDRLAEGIIDDIFPRNTPPLFWRIRIEIALRTFRDLRELEHLRENLALEGETDPVTGIHNRAALLSMLFRETDRVQRMNTLLSVMAFAIDDFEHWSERLGSAAWEDLLKQVVARVQRLLRSYDLFGRMGAAGFVLGLPGCSCVNAILLAERIREEVFFRPFRCGGMAVRLATNFGIAPSHGRSPLVVLREAEQALQAAQAAGPETIRSSRDFSEMRPAPANFLSEPAMGRAR